MPRCILGFRFSNKGFSFAVMRGSQAQPELVHSETVLAPTSFKACQIAKWTKQELDRLFATYTPNYAALKAFEGRSRNSSFEDRLRLEGILHLVAGENAIKDISRKRKSTIAKDFGFKGKGSYVSKIDTTRIPQYASLSEQLKDAVLVAWAELN